MSSSLIPPLRRGNFSQIRSFFFFLFLHKQNHNWVFFFEICNFSFLISDISELSKIAISRWFVLIQLSPPFGSTVQSLTKGQKVKLRRERFFCKKCRVSRCERKFPARYWVQRAPRLLLVRLRLCVCFSSICEVFSE